MKERITFHPASDGTSPRFSILIPSWNNLRYVKYCVESIRKNSRFTHQVIIHVNEGADGTLEWVKEQGLPYTYSAENVGVCYGFNAPASLAVADYIVLSDDDFYFAPDWDYHLWEEITRLDHSYFCLTGTMIEHGVSHQSCILHGHDFGKTVDTFDEARFLREFSNIPSKDWTGGNWYPLVLHRKIWNAIGGLSTEFFPGMGSDPDMMMKLWKLGVRYYKGLSKSRVYHFGSRTTSRVKRNNGNRQFLLKWGMTISTFFKYYLRMGDPFSGYSQDPDERSLGARRLRDKIKLKWETLIS